MMNYSAEVLGEMEQHDCVKAWFSLNLSVSIILSGVGSPFIMFSKLLIQ